jgi:hypothetical protein
MIVVSGSSGIAVIYITRFEQETIRTQPKDIVAVIIK